MSQKRVSKSKKPTKKKKKNTSQKISRKSPSIEKLYLLLEKATTTGKMDDWDAYFSKARSLKPSEKQYLDMNKKLIKKKLKPFLEYMRERWFLAGRFHVIDDPNFASIILKPFEPEIYKVSDMKYEISQALEMFGFREWSFNNYSNQVQILFYGKKP